MNKDINFVQVIAAAAIAFLGRELIPLAVYAFNDSFVGWLCLFVFLLVVILMFNYGNEASDYRKSAASWERRVEELLAAQEAETVLETKERVTVRPPLFEYLEMLARGNNALAKGYNLSQGRPWRVLGQNATFEKIATLGHWGDGVHRLDIRKWEGLDLGKGISLTEEETRALRRFLDEIDFGR